MQWDMARGDGLCIATLHPSFICIYIYISVWMHCIYWMLYGIRNALAKGWKENLISDLNGDLVTCREIFYVLDGSALEWELVWLRGMLKGGEVQGRGQGWERGALRAAGWEEPLESSVEWKDTVGRSWRVGECQQPWQWVMNRYLLSSIGISSHEILKFRRMTLEPSRNEVCVGRVLAYGRRLKKTSSPTKGSVACLHQRNVWVEMPHGGRSRTATRAPEPCMPAASQWSISWAVEQHHCSSLPYQWFATSVIWGRDGDTLPGLDLCGPQCPEHCLGAVIKCHIRNKKKGRQERVQMLKCPYISCKVNAWSRNKNFSEVDLEMGVCQQARRETSIGPKYC